MRRAGRSRRRGRRSRRFYKSADRKGELMINKTPARLHNCIAPRFKTRLEAGFSGILTNANSPATAFFTISGNGVHLPFNGPSGNGYTGKAFTSAGGGPQGTLVPATVALNALGAVGHNLLSNLYSQYRVYASSLQVTFTPSAGADGALLVICPVPGSGDISGFETQYLMSAPYSKAITCTGNNNVKQNRISHYMDSATALGMTRAQFQASLPTLTNADSAGTNNVNQWNWVVAYQMLSGSAPSSNVFVEVRMTFYVEYEAPQANLLDTGTDEP